MEADMRAKDAGANDKQESHKAFMRRIARRKPAADILSTYNGSIITLQPLSDAGREWIAENVDTVEAMNGEVFHCEYRMALDILDGAIAAGMRCMDSTSGRIAEVA